MSSLNKTFLLFILSALVLLIFQSGLSSPLSLNITNSLLNRTLWREDQSAITRQKSLKLAAAFSDFASNTQGEFAVTTLSVDTDCDQIPAMVIAEYHLKQGDIPAAAAWLNQASSAEPVPTKQESIILPSWVSTTPEGHLKFDWVSPNWRFRNDSQPADLTIDPERGWLTISYENDRELRDKVIYASRGPTSAPYWGTVYLRARIYPGSYLTFETHTKDGVQRHISYQQGDGDWQDFIFELDGNPIRFFYFSLSEPSKLPEDTQVTEYRVDIQPLIMNLNNNIGTCNL